jgi:hypothetical protein
MLWPGCTSKKTTEDIERGLPVVCTQQRALYKTIIAAVTSRPRYNSNDSDASSTTVTSNASPRPSPRP